MRHFGVVVFVLVISMLAAVPLAYAQKRVALVIGNSAYEHTPKLANPRNDATDMAAALRKHGFQVIEGLDLDKPAFDRKVRGFAGALKGSEAGVFFYAGHGLQVAGQNYLVPIDAKAEDAEALDFEMVRVDTIHRIMERQTNTNVLILDACRANPLARNLALAMGTRSAEIGRGLASVESGVGTLISFSTQPGNVALDGTGRNSPFAGALLKHLGASKEDLSAILIDVRNDVMRETQNKQVPWEHSALRGRFFFAARPSPSRPDTAAFYRLLMDRVLSEKIKRNSNPAMIGKTNPYRQESNPKSLAVCMNWDASTPEKPAFFWWSLATHRDELKPKNHAEIDRIAINRCKSGAESGARFECDCMVVDRNDRNVLTFPKAWLERHTEEEDRAKGGG